MPAILKILLVFAVVLTLARFRLPLGLALALGGVGLDLWAGHAPGLAASHLGDVLAGGEFWLFVMVMALIVEVGRYLTVKRNADEIVGSVRRWGGRHGRAATVMALPAVIGLIPMPAGAMVSAPFVQQAGGDGAGLENWKASVNYWFRHVWEYWWPLYPAVIIAMSIFEIDTWKFILAQIPFSVVAWAAGYFLLVRPHVTRLSADAGETGGRAARALVVLAPVAIVVAALIVVPPVLVRLAPAMDGALRKMTVLLAGLAAAAVFIVIDEWRAVRRGADDRIRVFSTLLGASSLNVQASLAGVLVFKHLLGTSGLLPLASRELLASGIPLSFAVAALPFLAGLVTGLGLGFTGSSFPMVVGLMAAPGSGLTPLSTLVLAYAFGYVGMMLSPVHLCLLTTRDYFSSSMRATLRAILPGLACILAWSLLAHIGLRLLGW